MTEQPTINVKARGVIRNWLVKISDIRRICVHKYPNSDDSAKNQKGTYIEIRYNNSEGYTNEEKPSNGCDQLVYSKDKVVIMFYKILAAIKRAKKSKDDYLIITENDVYLLSEVNITGI